MCCERLVCARCAGPVSEARCPACQAARAEVHAAPRLSAAAVALLVTALLAVVALIEVLTGR